MSFESVFFMKTVKIRWFKKYLKKKKIMNTYLFVTWLATYHWKNNIENCNSVGAGAHKLEKIVFGPVIQLWPWFFEYSENVKKGKLHNIEKGWSSYI